MTEEKKAEKAIKIEGEKTEVVKIEEKPATNKSDKAEKKSETIDKTTNNTSSKLAITFACIALVFSGLSAFFSYLSYEKASTPLTILNNGNGVDGNMTSFKEGSVADIVEQVSESVVSIVTSVKTRSFLVRVTIPQRPELVLL